VVVVQKLRELLLCYFLVPLCSKVQLSEASVHVEGNTYRLFHDSLKLRETNRASPIPIKELERCLVQGVRVAEVRLEGHKL